MRRNPIPWLLLAVALLALWLWRAPEGAVGHAPPAATGAPAGGPPRIAGVSASPTSPAVATPPSAGLPAFLPAEARSTIASIRRGGPFPHRQDGNLFGNREARLPNQSRGWYHEYTVDTPGAGNRGARRIVTGGNPPTEWYYSDDHYGSFRRFDPPGDAP